MCPLENKALIFLVSLALYVLQHIYIVLYTYSFVYTNLLLLRLLYLLPLQLNYPSLFAFFFLFLRKPSRSECRKT